MTLNLDGRTTCHDCGMPLDVVEHPADEREGWPIGWTWACTGCHLEQVDVVGTLPSWRDVPGCRPLVDEIERLRAEIVRLETP